MAEQSPGVTADWRVRFHRGFEVLRFVTFQKQVDDTQTDRRF